MRAAAKQEKMMWETLREAIDEEMEADPTVLVMGEQATPPRACGHFCVLVFCLLWLSYRPLQAFVVRCCEAQTASDAAPLQCWLASRLHARCIDLNEYVC